jgi:hypothetical protein
MVLLSVGQIVLSVFPVPVISSSPLEYKILFLKHKNYVKVNILKVFIERLCQCRELRHSMESL